MSMFKMRFGYSSQTDLPIVFESKALRVFVYPTDKLQIWLVAL